MPSLARLRKRDDFDRQIDKIAVRLDAQPLAPTAASFFLADCKAARRSCNQSLSAHLEQAQAGVARRWFRGIAPSGRGTARSANRRSRSRPAANSVPESAGSPRFARRRPRAAPQGTVAHARPCGRAGIGGREVHVRQRLRWLLAVMLVLLIADAEQVALLANRLRAASTKNPVLFRA